MNARQMATETRFAPTAAMRKYARACAAADVAPDAGSRCKAAGVSPRALARWRADPHFERWLRARVYELLAERAWEVWAVVHRLAREGNLTAAKLMLDRFAPGPVAPDAEQPDTFRELAELAHSLRDANNGHGEGNG